MTTNQEGITENLMVFNGLQSLFQAPQEQRGSNLLSCDNALYLFKTVFKFWVLKNIIILIDFNVQGNKYCDKANIEHSTDIEILTLITR